MPQLTDQQIAQYASGAGWHGNDLETAIAVAIAESSGDSGAIGDVSLQTDVFGPSVGLWQVRSVNPGYGNEFDQAHRNEQANVDPATNAANAHAIQQRFGWDQWSTYTSGAYQQYLPRARQATQANGTQAPAPTTPSGAPRGSTNGTGGSQNFLGELEKLIESIRRLLNPADKLNRAAQAARGAAASSSAFGRVRASSTAHQAHTSNTQKYSQHACRGVERVQTHSEDIKRTANGYETFSRQGAADINRTAAGVREDMVSPSVPPNIA